MIKRPACGSIIYTIPSGQTLIAKIGRPQLDILVLFTANYNRGATFKLLYQMKFDRSFWKMTIRVAGCMFFEEKRLLLGTGKI